MLSFLSYIWPFITVIITLTVIHEFGHYLAARAFAVKVEKFSIGFGPKLFCRKDKNGTEWQICAIPLGGYIKMLGEYEGEESVDPCSIDAQAPWKVFIISIAGPLANYISAVLCAFLLFICLGQRVFSGFEIAQIETNYTSEILSVEKGDVVTFIANSEKKVSEMYFARDHEIYCKLVPLKSDSDSVEIIMSEISHVDEFKTPASYVDITDTELQSSNAVSRTVNMLIATNKYSDLASNPRSLLSNIGISTKLKYETHSVSLQKAITSSVTYVHNVLIQTSKFLFGFFTGASSTKELGGVLSIAKISHDMSDSFYSLLMLFIALSVTTGLMNMLPIPGLDGGRALFSLVEVIIRRTLPKAMLTVSYYIGFGILICIFAFSIFNDISKMGLLTKLLQLFNFSR
jgi:regulator of sigma E protease